VIEVVDQLVVVCAMPPNVSVPVDEPKCVPVSATEEPFAGVAVLVLVTAGGVGNDVKLEVTIFESFVLSWNVNR
jgi:hypothetical protein